MSPSEDIDERVREAACVGDLELLAKLLPDANINSKNSMNGWTALHWACKRNHESVVRFLLEKGADKSVLNNEGNLPSQLTSNEDIRQVLGGSKEEAVKNNSLPITPNYLAHPPFPYGADSANVLSKRSESRPSQNTASYGSGDFVPANGYQTSDSNELVLKARLANSDDKDFIEIELNKSKRTYEELVTLLCSELRVDKQLVGKVRKLPDTIVRKDKDVLRFKDFQELELVLTNKAVSTSSAYKLGQARNHETILY